MPEPDSTLQPPGPRGCLASSAAAFVLAATAPIVYMIQRWRVWRRGSVHRLSIAGAVHPSNGETRVRLDVTLDVPMSAADAVRRRATDAVVRVAETLRRPDDAYHMVCRPLGDVEPLMLPLGPLVQSLGERLNLVLRQGSLAGRTVVWLALARERALGEVTDPERCNPEIDAERERLLASGDRWAAASSWARVGPSFVVRLILIVPAEAEARVRAILGSIAES